MGQVTIYLDDDTERLMVESAKAMHLSKSKWVATVIRERLAHSWPDTVRASAGSWSDFPLAEELRADFPADQERASF